MRNDLLNLFRFFAGLLENRLSPIVKALSDIAEIKFLDAPIEVRARDGSPRILSVKGVHIGSCLLRMVKVSQYADGGILEVHVTMKSGAVRSQQWRERGSAMGRSM